jgi:hypothetical protein
LEHPFDFDVARGATRRNKMFRVSSLLVAAMLVSSGTAFAADTTPAPSEKPGPSAGAVTSGAKPVTENYNKLPAPGEKLPSPGEVNKGKPKVAPQ